MLWNKERILPFLIQIADIDLSKEYSGGTAEHSFWTAWICIETNGKLHLTFTNTAVDNQVAGDYSYAVPIHVFVVEDL